MEITKFSRKMDGMGRITIPTRLREQMGLKIGEEYDFFLHEEGGERFIAISCGFIPQKELEEARELVKRYGMGDNSNKNKRK